MEIHIITSQFRGNGQLAQNNRKLEQRFTDNNQEVEGKGCFQIV